MTQSSNQEIYNKWAPILNDMGITVPNSANAFLKKNKNS